MVEWLDRLLGIVDDVRPEGAKRLVRLTLIGILFAVIWIAAVSQVTKGAIAWAPALVFGAFAAVCMLMAIVRSMTYHQHAVDVQVDRLQTAVDSLREPKAAAFHLGCRIGRRRLECGLLEVIQPTRGLPEADQVRSHGLVRREAAQGRFYRDDLYECLVDALREQIEKAAHMQVRVESIGLGVPGGVLPDRGQFDRAVEGVAFRPNEFVARSLAARLHSVCGAGLLETVLGVEDTNALASVIHLDNDARCAARWLITDRGPTWRNFACVFAGSGLGSGLVFDRSIFYGSSFRAGEVGHVNLNMSDHLLIGGADIKPRLCSCGVRGYHYESLVNIGGIGHLAQAMDAEMLAVLRESYTADEDRAARLRMRAVDADDAAGMILLRTLSASGYGLPDGASARPEIGDYLARVARQYGELFSVGLIAILDALDVEHVALCGTIPEALQGNRDFIRTLDERIAGSVLGAHTPTTFGDMGYWGWRGAALLPRDPGYVARRFPVEAAQGVLPG